MALRAPINTILDAFLGSVLSGYQNRIKNSGASSLTFQLRNLSFDNKTIAPGVHCLQDKQAVKFAGAIVHCAKRVSHVKDFSHVNYVAGVTCVTCVDKTFHNKSLSVCQVCFKSSNLQSKEACVNFVNHVNDVSDVNCVNDINYVSETTSPAQAQDLQRNDKRIALKSASIDTLGLCQRKVRQPRQLQPVTSTRAGQLPNTSSFAHQKGSKISRFC